ncbi:hypothetical protein Q428_11705 [Fervidicella metallireducens AeB]|uniref:Uncharacterized protein n=1 Tax=Fervidicella metallireducens AeB TaxID=1403537 RepID=A0A017RSW6_9CLOT|nr:hypothetical protein [Fervidicella metallireducens]EYE87752.1 hypothetical protein Q428_11705 [Fervidicella metallireducens AeB]
MAFWFLILLVILLLIYQVVFVIPKSIVKLEEKIDILRLHMQEIEIRLNEIDKKIK